MKSLKKENDNKRDVGCVYYATLGTTDLFNSAHKSLGDIELCSRRQILDALLLVWTNKKR